MTASFGCHGSSANAKKWEVELHTLKNNNARLTTALQESTANVEEWKKQLAMYKEESARMKLRVSIPVFPLLLRLLPPPGMVLDVFLPLSRTSFTLPLSISQEPFHLFSAFLSGSFLVPFFLAMLFFPPPHMSVSLQPFLPDLLDICPSSLLLTCPYHFSLSSLIFLTHALLPSSSHVRIT